MAVAVTMAVAAALAVAAKAPVLLPGRVPRQKKN